MGVEAGELLFPGVAGGIEEPDAAVPAEDGVVIAGGADFFGLAEALQGALEKRKNHVGRLAVAELRFGAAFVEDAGVIELLVALG